MRKEQTPGVKNMCYVLKIHSCYAQFRQGKPGRNRVARLYNLTNVGGTLRLHIFILLLTRLLDL